MKYTRALITASLLVVMCFAASLFETSVYASNSPVDNTDANAAKDYYTDELEIMSFINRERQKKGLSDLAWDNSLEKMAREYSQKMAHGKFFSHYEKNGNSVVERAGEKQIKNWRKIGENLFVCEQYKGINKLAVEQWMKSPMHRQNILDRDFNTSGIGIAEAKDGTIYITQVFLQK